MKKHVSDSQRPFSSILFDGDERAAARAMLYPVGFKVEDFKKPLIGVASTWSDVTPCNMHIDKLAREAETGANSSGGKAIIFNTITISDGISMGTEGMKYSLVSREVIADSIETVVGCAGMDGFVAIGGCDKNMPGSMIAIARLNRAAVFVYGGTILPGCITGDSRKLDVVSVFEAIGAHANKKISDAEFHGLGHRGARHEPAQQLGAKRDLPGETGGLPPRQRVCPAHAQDRSASARYFDEKGL
jgi:dihydroxy-acid dehydratase